METGPVFSALDAEDFTPPRSPRTYRLAPLSYRQRTVMRREMRRAGGHAPDRSVMLSVLRECLTVLQPDNLDVLLAQVDDAEAAPDDVRATAKLAVLEHAAMGVQAYADMIDARIRYNEAMPWVSARFALRGWSGPGLPAFERVDGMVPEALLELLPAAELDAIGSRATVLIWLGPSAEGNSVAPSPAPAIPPDTEAA